MPQTSISLLIGQFVRVGIYSGMTRKFICMYGEYLQSFMGGGGGEEGEFPPPPSDWQ